MFGEVHEGCRRERNDEASGGNRFLYLPVRFQVGLPLLYFTSPLVLYYKRSIALLSLPLSHLHGDWYMPKPLRSLN